MRRSVLSYLSDIVDACDSIESTLTDVDLEAPRFRYAFDIALHQARRDAALAGLGEKLRIGPRTDCP